MDRTGPLRTVPASLAFLLFPVAAVSQAIPFGVEDQVGLVEYRLGGAAEVSVRAPQVRVSALGSGSTARFRYPDRIPLRVERDALSDTVLGQLSVFGSEGLEDGRDVLRLGSALTRGKTTTGFSVTYGDEVEPSRSEVFVDYALTEAFSVGVSGIVSDEGQMTKESVARLGLSASYALKGGSFLQGGVADAPDTSPVFGLAVGLRF